MNSLSPVLFKNIGKKGWISICFILFLGESTSAADLVKLGTYDFSHTMKEMSDEPYLRAQFPDALGSPLFTSLMMENLASQTKAPSSKENWESRVQDYGQYFTMTRLKEVLEKRVANYQKSGKMKDDLVIGLSLASQYRGYSMILKPQDSVLYTRADMGASIASVLADYLSQPIDDQADENTDSTPDGGTQ